MKKVLFGLAALLGLGGPALAQNTTFLSVTTCGDQAYLAGRPAPPTVNLTGVQCVAATITPSGTQDVNLAQVAGATVQTGNGTAAGTIRVAVASDNTAFTVNAAQSGTWNIATVTAVTAITNALPAGTAILGKVGIDQTTDVTTNGVEIAPTAGAAAGLTAVISGAAEGTHVFKASAGNLYSYYVTTGAVSGYVMLFNATTAPVDGAVTPIECIQAPANSTISASYNPGPASVFSTGISAAFSSTGCFTKTVSATAFFHGNVK